METRTCTVCGKEKPIVEYSRDAKGKNGIRCICKKCDSIKRKLNYRTMNGCISQIYNHQVSSSRQRQHDKPPYSKEEFKNWLLTNTCFVDMYNKWVDSGYDRWLIPSCDRTDDTRGYSLDRLNVLTWREHCDTTHRRERNGLSKIGTKYETRPVVGVNVSDGSVIRFVSACEAERQTKAKRPNIHKCCEKGARYTAAGYNWYYEKDYDSSK